MPAYRRTRGWFYINGTLGLIRCTHSYLPSGLGKWLGTPKVQLNNASSFYMNDESQKFKLMELFIIWNERIPRGTSFIIKNPTFLGMLSDI